MLKRVPFENVAEAERLARRRVPRAIWLAIKAGNEKGWTLADNVAAFDELGFTPTVFGRPTERDLSTEVMGVPIGMPVMVAPVGAQAMHPGGEVAAARAAARADTVMGLSQYASNSIREVAAVNGKTFAQLYWAGTRDQIAARVAEAKASGAAGLIITLDWSFTPRRDWGVPPSPPKKLDLKTMAALSPIAGSRPAWLARYLMSGRIPELRAPNMFTASDPNPMFGAAWQTFERTAPPTWNDIEWLRELWGGPFMVKGITTLEDAKLAADLGADAISVSNHGGNNIDGTPSPLRILPTIVDAVGDRLDVVTDGGVRRGSDVVKALALGAKAVFIGRAYLYGLSVAGEDGVHRILEVLRAGIDETLFGIGRSSVREVARDDVVQLNRDFFVRPTR